MPTPPTRPFHAAPGLLSAGIGDPSRRAVLKAGAALAAGLGLAGVDRLALAQPAPGKPLAPAGSARVLRLAHLTDPHIQTERRGDAGTAACLAHALGGPDKPDLILTGGDLVFDSFETSLERAQSLWKLFTKSIAQYPGVAFRHTLGNHDVWGWNKAKSGTTGGEAGWGKKLACDTLGLAKPYYAFTQAGWKLIVLDSVFPDGESYMGRFDDEQFEWLSGELAGTPATTPVLICSHIPILTATALLRVKEDIALERTIPPAIMHVDAWRMVSLFLKHPNVRLCLSGHIHELDRIEYQGVTYLCDGAVSGNWWKGRNKQCDEGYGLIDLFADGSFTHSYQTYGWKAAPA